MQSSLRHLTLTLKHGPERTSLHVTVGLHVCLFASFSDEKTLDQIFGSSDNRNHTLQQTSPFPSVKERSVISLSRAAAAAAQPSGPPEPVSGSCFTFLPFFQVTRGIQAMPFSTKWVTLQLKENVKCRLELYGNSHPRPLM